MIAYDNRRIKMDKFTFTLTKEQLDTVFKALGELPLKESILVFTELNNQCMNQLEKKD